MNLPVQVTFRHMDSSPALEARVRDEAATLDRYFNRITSCRVVIEPPPRKGKSFHVSIDLGVPGGELAVNHQPNLHSAVVQGGEVGMEKHHELDPEHKDAYVAIRDAFEAIRRQLEHYVEKMRGEVKRHE